MDRYEIPDPSTDRDGWLRWRKGGIGGSDAAAIIGEDKYNSPLDIYLDKSSLLIDDEMSLACERGLALEPEVAKRYMRETGKTVRRQKSRIHPDHDYIHCSMDYQILADGIVDQDTGLLECKTANTFVFNQIRLQGLPMYMWVQVQHNLMVTGYTWGAIAILQPDSWKFIHFNIKRDDEFCGRLLKAEVEFWKLVENQTPPEVVPVDLPKVPECSGDLTMVDSLAPDLVTQFRGRLDAYCEIKAIADEAEAIMNSHKSVLQSWMLENAIDVIEGFGKRVYYREQSGRKSFDQKAFKAAHPDIDLDDFQKQGAPFRTFKVYDRPLQIEGK